MLKQIIIGFIILFFGFSLLYYAPKIIQTFGLMEPVERVMGSGRTYLVVRLIGLAFMLAGFLYMTGLADDFLRSIFGIIFNV